MSQTPNLLTSADTCAELAIDRSTLSRWVASERITPAYKMPGPRGAFLFAPDEVARVKGELRGAAAS